MFRGRLALPLSCAAIAVGCGSEPASSETEKIKLVVARSVSSHYLELQFEEPASGAYLEPGNYEILSADGTALTVLAARPSDD
jgi:hypothetical protein